MKMKKFLKMVIDRKKETLMGLIIDRNFQDSFLQNHDEIKARLELEGINKELKEQNSKVQVDKKGKITKDDRDLDKIDELQKEKKHYDAEINMIQKVKQEREQNVASYDAVNEYIKTVQNLPQKIKKDLKNIESI